MILALTTSRRTCLFFLFFLRFIFNWNINCFIMCWFLPYNNMNESYILFCIHSYSSSLVAKLALVYQNSKLTFIFNSLKVCYVTRNALYRKVKHGIQFLFNEEHLYCIGCYLTMALWQSSRVSSLTFCFFSNWKWNNNTCIVFLMG